MNGLAAETAVKRGGARRHWAVTVAPIAIATAILAKAAIGRIVEKVGHAGATLDDAYIHFQYARAFAEGHPFRYQTGEPFTSGATSVLWPAILAPFYAIGFRGEAILWPAWVLSFTALGGLAYEAYALTSKLAGRQAAAGAASMVLAFSAFSWFAASGMEAIPFAWAMARGARRASEWMEDVDARTLQARRELVALAWIAPLLRPEGAIATLMIVTALALRPRVPTLRERGYAIAAIAALAATPALLWALTGHASSTTAQVKLLPGNPYFQGAALVAKIVEQGRMLVGELLDGQRYSSEFLPAGGAPFAMIGLVAIGALGVREDRRWRALFVIASALTMFVTCAYYTFLWNRLRYLWPFATGWIVGLACLARLVGDLCALVRPRWRIVTTLLCGVMTGMLAMRLDWTLDDAAGSASGIDRQQVALGRWVKSALPEDARVGVNDTGAIAYFGDRRTFDVVGLTTRTEGRYWVAGAGSRLEHYERMHAGTPRALPTHFVVYPEWFACEAVLGRALHQATVTDATILGGETMRVYEADYARLGSGEAPWSGSRQIVDGLDVADLESEEAHRYALLGAQDGEQIAAMAPAPDGRVVVDGGRTMRARERFVAHLPERPVRAIVRLEAQELTRVHMLAGDREIGAFDVPPLGWMEATFELPASTERAMERETVIELRTDAGPVTVFHYWFDVSAPE